MGCWSIYVWVPVIYGNEEKAHTAVPNVTDSVPNSPGPWLEPF